MKPYTHNRIDIIERHSGIAFIAPHGGNMEPWTTEIARFLSGTAHSFYSCTCLKSTPECRRHHVPSHLFDEPHCMRLLGKTKLVISIHGMNIASQKIIVGGLYDSRFLMEQLKKLGFYAEPGILFPRISGKSPRNICNKGTVGKGVQLEMGSLVRFQIMHKRIMRNNFKKAMDEFIVHVQ